MIAHVTPSMMAPRPAALPQPAPRRMRILVVEEDLWLTGLLRDVLCWDGHVVDYVRDAAAARQAGAESYDGIVLGLLGQGGRDTCRSLRAQGIAAPIVILDPRATVDDVVDGLNAGADDYLAGLADRDELVARLRALIRRYRAGAQAEGAPARA